MMDDDETLPNLSDELPGGVLIRPYEPGDAEAVRALLAEGGIPADGLGDTLLLVAEEPGSGQVVATGGLEVREDIGLVRFLTVALSAAGKGLSRTILDSLEFAARARSVEVMYHFTAAPAPLLTLGWAPSAEPDAPKPPPDALGGPEPPQLVVKQLRARPSEEIRALVREHYDRIASGTPGVYHRLNPTYTEGTLYNVPRQAVRLRIGCANPLEFCRPHAGDTVLDLGCGAGIDCFLAAALVGPEGHVIGVDLSPVMLEEAATAAAEAELRNIEWREGLLEDLPVNDASVYLVTANCSVNLALDKGIVFAEAFRVLKPGGRLIVADVVSDLALPELVRTDPTLLCACIGGAIPRDRYLAAVAAAGFTNIELLREVDYPSIEGASTRSILLRARKLAA